MPRLAQKAANRSKPILALLKAALTGKDRCQSEDEGNQSENSLKEWIRDDRFDRFRRLLCQIVHRFIPLPGRMMQSHLPPIWLLNKANSD